MSRLVTGLILCSLLVACDQRIDLPRPDPVPTQPPVILSFTADATRLGNSFLDTYLRWDVVGDNQTRCRIDPGIGNVALGGFIQIRPGISKDYLLTCVNPVGTVVRIVSIIVG